MVSTHYQTNIARRNQMVSISTACASTGVLYLSSMFVHGGQIPGFIYSTVNTYINFPIEKENSDIAFVIIYDGVSTTPTGSYAAVSLQLRPTTMGGFTGSLFDSTVDAAFERIYSTSAFAATSTSAQAFILGPVDTYRYACNYGNTSSGDVDRYQNFIRMMVGYSTVAKASGGCSHDALSTSIIAGGYYICPIQFGSTKLGT